MWQRERVESRAELGVAAPVAAQHERVVFGEIVVDAHERRCIVVEPLVGRERRCEREPETPNEIEEVADGIRVRAQPLERQRIGGEQREERIGAPGERESAEGEKLVLEDGPTSANADLVLVVLLSEGGVGVVDELETRIAPRVAHRTLDVVRASARRRCNLAAGELTARDVVGAGYDARAANCLLWNAPRSKAESIERNVVLVRGLSGD